MKISRTILALLALGALVLTIPSAPSMRRLCGVLGVKIGMARAQVMRALEAGHRSHKLLAFPNGLSLPMHGNHFFRHAHLRFDQKGRLIAIALTLREVLSRKRVLDDLRLAYNLRLSTGETVAAHGVAITLEESWLLLRDISAMRVTAQSSGAAH